MEEDHYFDEDNEGDGLPPQEWKSALASAATALDNSNGCFDCNICLDNAVDPIVTLCGHLYCWPCIYKWLHFQNNDSTSTQQQQQQQQCPVCKTCISQTTLIPLYGRGHSTPHTQFKENNSHPTLNVPHRPSTCGVLHSLITTSRRRHRSRDYNLEETSSMPTRPTGLHPTVGMFGEMIYGRVFGNSESEDGLYWYPNSYNHIGRMSSSSSPRVRRQQMQAVKSLNRISIFLFCCVICCLILF